MDIELEHNSISAELSAWGVAQRRMLIENVVRGVRHGMNINYRQINIMTSYSNQTVEGDRQRHSAREAERETAAARKKNRTELMRLIKSQFQSPTQLHANIAVQKIIC